MLTPAQLRAAAVAARAEAAGLELKAAALRVYAGDLDELAQRGLTIDPYAGTVQTPMHVESAGAKRSAGQFAAAQSKHPFVAMLTKRKLSVADVAAHLGVPRSTVQAWYKDATDPSARAIPEDAARGIRDKYGVPLSAWPRIRAAK
jgi:hypothetical protein